MKENNYCTHGIHPYHAKFIPAIPREFILEYSKPNDIILDPFCGSGTTLLEAMISNHDSYGVDMNYIAYKIAKAKTFIPDLSVLDKYFNFIINSYQTYVIYEKKVFDNKEKWFTKEVADFLDRIFYSVSKIEDENYKNIFDVLISSILKTVSNKREVWNNGYIADNVLPNKEYTGDYRKVLINKYKNLKKSYQELTSLIGNDNGKANVVLSDITQFNPSFKFDMVITSPPYPFAVDFVKYNRLTYYWFGWNVDETSEKETGCRGKRNRKNAIDDFFKEMEVIYKHIFSLVKTNGYFCMTVADTQRKNEKVSFIEWLYNIFNNNGWVLVSDEIRELQCQSMAQKRIQYEHKLVFQKKV